MSGLLSAGGLLPPSGGLLGAKAKMALRPFDSSESVQNPDGSLSTERTVTIPTQDGWVNVPSLWMGPSGPVDVMTMPNPEDRIGWLLQQFEMQNGPAFQRFGTVEEATEAARRRSNAGGAHSGMKR